MLIKIEKLAQKIEQLKQQYKLTNEDISSIMGINYSYLFRVLKNERQPGKKVFDAIGKLCKTYKLDINDFIFL